MDIMPYQCFEVACQHESETYDSLKRLQKHYKKFHSTAAILQERINYGCPFCEEILGTSLKYRFTHIGTHLENIAFSIVNYEHVEWMFYSDADSDVAGAADASDVPQTPHTDLRRTRAASQPAISARHRPARQPKPYPPLSASHLWVRQSYVHSKTYSQLHPQPQSKPQPRTESVLQSRSERSSSLVSFSRRIFKSHRHSATASLA